MHERFFCVLKCASHVCILPDPDIFAMHNSGRVANDMSHDGFFLPRGLRMLKEREEFLPC